MSPEEEERLTLQLTARMYWTESEWRMVEHYEHETDDVSIRCSWRTRAHPVGDLIETGEDLPGSWHQQSNGGRRVWYAVKGEIECQS